MANIRIKRGTRAQLNAAATANQLNTGEPYLISDEGRSAVGTSAGTYKAAFMQGDKLALADVAQSSAANGQAPVWNGSAWVPANISVSLIDDEMYWIGL